MIPKKVTIKVYQNILITGTIGTGKTSSSRIIANTMNEGQAKPIELDCASHNGVDDMREILEECHTRPLIGKYKIFLMDECHMLTVQAWNSLLKVLEEPPSYVIFLFCTTDPQKIIQTILSRVQRFNFSRISTEGIIQRLKYIISQENKDSLNDITTQLPDITTKISLLKSLNPFYSMKIILFGIFF